MKTQRRKAREESAEHLFDGLGDTCGCSLQLTWKRWRFVNGDFETRRSQSSSIAKDTKPSRLLSRISWRRRSGGAKNASRARARCSGATGSSEENHRPSRARYQLNHTTVFAMFLAFLAIFAVKLRCGLRVLRVSIVMLCGILAIFASLRFHCARRIVLACRAEATDERHHQGSTELRDPRRPR